MIACGVLSLAFGVVLFVGRHPRQALRLTPPSVRAVPPVPPSQPEYADTWPSLPPPPLPQATTSQPGQLPDDDDEVPTARRTPRRASYIQVHSEAWWGEAVCGGCKPGDDSNE